MKNVSKIIAITGIILIIGLGVYLLFLKIYQPNPTANEPKKTVTVSSGFIIPPENAEKMTIISKSPGGTESLDVNNIYKDPVVTLSNGIVDFKSTNDYLMEFQPAGELFLITIQNSEDIYGARTRAENDFLNSLGIIQEKACGLNISLAIPFRVNEKNAGREFGLSFCPDGKPFE